MLIFVMTILQLQSFKTQITTNTRAVVDNGLLALWPNGLAKQLLIYPACREKSLNPVKTKFFT